MFAFLFSVLLFTFGWMVAGYWYEWGDKRDKAGNNRGDYYDKWIEAEYQLERQAKALVKLQESVSFIVDRASQTSKEIDQ